MNLKKEFLIIFDTEESTTHPTKNNALNGPTHKHDAF